MAADAVVSAVLEKLTSVALDEIEKAVRQVINVRGEVNKLSSNFRAIKAVLEDAERQQLDKGKAGVRDWLDKLKDVSYDIDNALDEWSTAIHKSELEPKPKVCSFVPSPSYCFNRGKLLLKTAHKIQDLNKRLDVIAIEKERYGFKVLNSEKPKRDETTSFINVAEVMGRVEDKERIVNMLLNEGRIEEIGSKLQMISLVGIGGIGKTTLAKLAFNNEKVKSHFEAKIWVCVSDTFSEMKIAKDILKFVICNADKDVIEKLHKLNSPFEEMDKLRDAIVEMEKLRDTIERLDKLQDVLPYLKTSIEGKKFLLVLDDVWTEEYGNWDQLRHLLLSTGSQGSKILVTTRKEGVARVMGCELFKVGELSEEEGWSFFSQIAFFGRSNDDCRNLEEIGRKIANKCKGLPLALKTLGGLMRLKQNIIGWQSVLESEVWKLKEAEEGLFHPLMFSYFDLPPHLRQCFSYCAIFPKDYVIEKKMLIELWMAQGFLRGTQDMEMVGENNFNDLSMRFLFQDFEMDENGGIIKCKMHDMVHDFAVFLTRGECLTMGSSSSIQCSNGRTRHFFFMMQTEETTAIQTCTKNLHTLLIESNGRNPISHIELLKLFDRLKCLRVLKCSDSRIKKCPKQIGKLIHLRHLDLSENRELKELPKAVCDLYNLLILDISGCYKLKILPHRMGNLINLLHLRNERIALNFMPKGLKKLTSLKTLNVFVVTYKGVALSDLGNLNHLCGTLSIGGLGSVRDQREAEKAQLQNKKGITNLTLKFDLNGLPVSQANESPSIVFEALKLPSDLETLELHGYQSTFSFIQPSWMVSLTKLKELVILKFVNVEQWPPLGKLPSLESLVVNGMQKVKKVGVEFLGIEMSLSTSSSSVVAFPNLKTLQFYYMNEWEEWEEWDSGSRGEIMPHLFSLTIHYCPKLMKLPDYILQNTTLQKLIISYSSDAVVSNLFKKDCKPHISRISNMDVEGEKEIVGHTNPIVWPSPNWITPLTNLKNIEINRCNVEHLPPLGKLPSLESLTMSGMWEVKKVGVEFLGIEMSLSPSSSSVVAFPNLKTLQFSLMHEWEEWEEWDYGSRGEIMPRLSSFIICYCSKLKKLPDYILRNTTLQELNIFYSSDTLISNLLKEDCRPHISCISNVDVEGEKEIVGYTNPIVWAGPSWITPLTNLKNIVIQGGNMEHLLPLGKLSSLESLKVSSNGVVKKVGVEFLGIETSLSPSSSSVFSFPNLKSLAFQAMGEWEEWDYESRGEEDITIMPRLSSLTIRFCRKLKMLPDYILQSTTLQELTIFNCSIISKRCKEDYQPFIDRIPHSEVQD
ncbi:hypothetical protein SLEP1_g39308 [Rubroshorea leprosula]|uniref:Uncharacterized protein n=1 Tax=Rubroshorea leprosula TaxID=152421 RepID=A0AAV5L0A5_9ROSI|nr:hypothetical protein SLEP1_g39308 [Rubroshorea leprosula]